MREKKYIYKEKENSEILWGGKPRDIERWDRGIRWELGRLLLKGRKKWRLKRRLKRSYKRNKSILGIYYMEKGVIRRKTRKKLRRLGVKKEGTLDSRISSKEWRRFTKKGVKTRKVWLSEMPILLNRGNLKRKRKPYNLDNRYNVPTQR